MHDSLTSHGLQTTIGTIPIYTMHLFLLWGPSLPSGRTAVCVLPGRPGPAAAATLDFPPIADEGDYETLHSSDDSLFTLDSIFHNSSDGKTRNITFINAFTPNAVHGPAWNPWLHLTFTGTLVLFFVSVHFFLRISVWFMDGLPNKNKCPSFTFPLPSITNIEFVCCLLVQKRG